MKGYRKEKRAHERYDTEVKIFFRVTYNIKTKLRFQVVDKDEDEALSRKYSALSKNVSAAGICFISGKKLAKRDRLYLELYLPKAKYPIRMEGEVRWSQSVCSAGKTRAVKKTPRKEDARKFSTGVRLITVNGKPVDKTIRHDKNYKIIWSIVLESVLGSFRTFAKERRKS